MRYVDFAEEHLAGVVGLCEAEGWPTFPADPARALRVLTAPGVVSVVALEDGAVVGFAQMLTDGEIQAFLNLVDVAAAARGRGIATRLVREAFARSGAQRVDLLALEDSTGFYRSFTHRTFAGYRVYPESGPSDA